MFVVEVWLLAAVPQFPPPTTVFTNEIEDAAFITVTGQATNRSYRVEREENVAQSLQASLSIRICT